LLSVGQIARVGTGVGPGEIQRLDRERVVTVGANAEGRALSAVIGDIQKAIAAVPLPAGYSLGQGGEGEEQQEVFGDMIAAMGMAVLLTLVIPTIYELMDKMRDKVTGLVKRGTGPAAPAKIHEG